MSASMSFPPNPEFPPKTQPRLALPPPGGPPTTTVTGMLGEPDGELPRRSASLRLQGHIRLQQPLTLARGMRHALADVAARVPVVGPWLASTIAKPPVIQVGGFVDLLAGSMVRLSWVRKSGRGAPEEVSVTKILDRDLFLRSGESRSLLVVGDKLIRIARHKSGALASTALRGDVEVSVCS